MKFIRPFFLLWLMIELAACTLHKGAEHRSVLTDRHSGNHPGCSLCAAQKSQASPDLGDSLEWISASETKVNHLIKTNPNDALKSRLTHLELSRMLPLVEMEDSIPRGCDHIIFKNGDELAAKILEVGPNEIKYKKCDYLEGPTYSVERYSVFMIKYANGSKDVFNEERTVPTVEKKVDDNSTKTDLNYFDKYESGVADARLYHFAGGWFWLGLLLGLLGIVIAAVVTPSPNKRIKSDLKNDSAYQKGYAAAARKKNVVNAVLGWLVWLFILVLFVL